MIDILKGFAIGIAVIIGIFIMVDFGVKYDKKLRETKENKITHLDSLKLQIVQLKYDMLKDSTLLDSFNKKCDELRILDTIYSEKFIQTIKQAYNEE